jgi:phage tail-like protein
MDANQSRFQLLLGRDDWARCATDSGSPILDSSDETLSPFSWNDSRSELTLGVRINVFHSAPGNQPPTMEERRGAGQDRYGNWYWIADSQTEILVNSSGSSATTHFWSAIDELSTGCGTTGEFGARDAPVPEMPFAFSGLAVTEEHYLVAGVLEPAGLAIFDLFHGGPPRRVFWPSAIPFTPFGITPAPGGGVWILDRANRRLWALDKTFAVLCGNQAEVVVSSNSGDVFVSAGPGPQPARTPRTFPAGISLESASLLSSIDAISLAALPDGSVLLLESDSAGQFSNIYRFRNGVQIGDPVSLDGILLLLEPQDRPGFQLLGFDFAFIALEQTPFGQRQNTLYVVGQNGDQSWAFTADYSTDQLALTPLPEYYPMRQFGGRGLVAGQTQVYYDSAVPWVPLTIQKRPQYVEEATLLTFVLDGKQPDCVWHRLMLDASIPASASVTIYSRAHNDRNFLQVQSWTEEPGPYMRGNGTEIPWTQIPQGLGTWELLLQNAVGQYLQLMITLSGNRQLTPRIRALRVYYPRFSYLDHYLPGVYRDDDQSASFIDRFLANFEGFYTSIEDRISTVQALFDAGSAPCDALEWLADWFGVALDPSWSEAKRRLFLNNASTFFEARGTVPGLMMALRLTLEDCADQGIFDNPLSEPQGVRLVEGFSKRRIPAGLLQNPSADIGLPSKAQVAVWTPALGADELNRRYSQSLQTPGVSYPIYLASTDPQYKQWSAFSMANLGLLPSQPDSDSELWPTFLSTRYRSVGALNSAYGATFASFGDVPFPSALMRQSQPLWDWYQFQGPLLIESAAHQFTVFLPMLPADAQNVMAHRSKMDLAQRVIDLEKPAHTSYEMAFYWAFFRVGDARLGEDTVLDYGSRAPQLLQPVLLGDTYLGSAYVSRQPKTRPFLNRGSC